MTPKIFLGVIVAAVGVVVVILAGFRVGPFESKSSERRDPRNGLKGAPKQPRCVEGKTTSVQRTPAPRVPKREPLALPAHVLLAIDTSLSMHCLVYKNDPHQTRIEAARGFVLPAIDVFVEPDDQLGLWIFRTSRRSPRRVKPLINLRRATPAQRRTVKRRIARLKPGLGGTPLYDAIAQGVKHLQGGAGEDSPDAVLSLVIITDADENTDDRAGAKQRLKAVPDHGNVRVLITAQDGTLCTDVKRTVRRTVKGSVVMPFDLHCFPAGTRTLSTKARHDIVALLRKPLP